eukprot:PhM_4_TR18860/c0_g1_i2/m.19086
MSRRKILVPLTCCFVIIAACLITRFASKPFDVVVVAVVPAVASPPISSSRSGDDINIISTSFVVPTDSRPILTQPAVAAASRRGYLYFANQNGRHNNQLKALAHAFVFADALNLTLVVPPFGLASPGSSSSVAWFTDLYSVSDELREMFVEERDFFTGIKTKNQQHEITRNQVLCLPRIGIPSKVPRTLNGLVEVCRGSSSGGGNNSNNLLLRTRNHTSVLERVRERLQNKNSNNNDNNIVLVYFYETIYYDEVDTSCFWRAIRPKRFSRAVAVATVPLLVVHIRHLEGTCVERITKLFRKAKLFRRRGNNNLVIPTWQCFMGSQPTAVELIQQSLQIIAKNSNHTVFQYHIAHDGAKSTRREVDGLIRSLQSIGGEQYNAQNEEPLAIGGGLGPLLRDVALGIDADVFVGNQASTVSVNICAMRKARGKQCVGWVNYVNPDEVRNPKCGD